MSEQFTVNLLGGFEVYRDGQLLDLPPSCRRLVALVALKRRAVPRSWVCRALWPTIRHDRAAARLRTTLWRLRPIGADPLVIVKPESIEIAHGASVDWHDAVELIGTLLGHLDPLEPDRDLEGELLPLLRAGELLTGWTDEWNAHSRRVYHELRVDALEILVGPCAQNG
jgi:DNA-binding SARP family transcriptional activator